MPIDTTELKKFENVLLKMNKTGLRIAREMTVNDMAYATRENAVKTINKEFTTRNAFTTSGRTLKVDKMTRSRQFAEVGHTEQYMREQEFSFTKRPDRYTKSVAIPTPVASGERTGMAQGKTIRKKPVRKPNRRNMMKMPSNKMRDIPRRQRTPALIREAIKTKRRFIEIERNGQSSIYKVRGSKKRYKLDRMYTTEHRTIQVKATPWLTPSQKEAVKKREEFYRARLTYQLNRLR